MNYQKLLNLEYSFINKGLYEKLGAYRFVCL